MTTSAGVAIVVPTSAPHTDAPRCSAGPSSQPAAIAAVFIESYPHKCPVPISEPRTMRQGEEMAAQEMMGQLQAQRQAQLKRHLAQETLEICRGPRRWRDYLSRPLTTHGALG